MKKVLPIALAVLALAVVVWGLVMAFKPQVLPLQGQVEAQEILVASKIPARVARVAVRPGQQVAAGELLFELDSPEVRAKLAQAEGAQAAAQAVAAKAEAGARVEEIEMARQNWLRARTAADVAETTYRRVNAMAEEGVLALQKRDEAQAQAQAAQQQAAAAQAQYEMARRGARVEDRRAAEAQAVQVGGMLAEAEAALADTRIHAPAAGEVARVQIQPGELAPQGFAVITLVDLRDRWVVLHVREDELAAFPKGSTHQGHVTALNQTLPFTVTAVAVQPDFATWRAARPGGTDLRTFELRLAPPADAQGLRPGMGVVFK